MKSKLLYLGLILTASSARADFDPIPIRQGSYNAAVIVENTVGPVSIIRHTRASMDAGTNNTGFTWYEIGFNTNSAATLTTGLPLAESTFTHQTFADHSYTMAPSYTAPNAVLISPGQVLNGSLSFSAPAPYSS